ncbi:MAG: hypothetical protein M1834_005221 [Cirrosporium novae-zelandiae]|nr:MAG: hypothetical protein M1834_005221 [Cirrosporium novae-zelandiae]
MATTPPNCTLYVKNLEERIKIPDLIESLTEIFSEYGTIIDVVAKRNLKAKGQAFIVFEDHASAQKAIEDIQGFELFDKPMQLDFARTRSDATVLRVGGKEELDVHKKKRIAEKERKQAQQAAEAAKLKRAAPGGQEGVHPAKKTIRGTGLKSSNPTTAAVVPDEYLPPNRTLFVQNIPDGYDADGLGAIFGRFEGFREVRLVPGRKGIAFIEYEAEAGAISAKENTAGMALGDEGKVIRVTYQRQ